MQPVKTLREPKVRVNEIGGKKREVSRFITPGSGDEEKVQVCFQSNLFSTGGGSAASLSYKGGKCQDSEERSKKRSDPIYWVKTKL